MKLALIKLILIKYMVDVAFISQVKTQEQVLLIFSSYQEFEVSFFNEEH